MLYWKALLGKSVLCVMACLCWLISPSYADSAPQPPPCGLSQINAMYPANQSKIVPIDARLYIIVTEDTSCNSWDTAKLSLAVNDATSTPVDGVQKMTVVGEGVGTVRLITFTPKEPLQPETGYTLTYKHPEDPSLGGWKTEEKRLFTTTAVKADQRVPTASFAFTQAVFWKQLNQCQYGLTLSKENTQNGDLIFIHHYLDADKKVIEAPVGVVGGIRLADGGTGFSKQNYALNGCSQERICVQIQLVSENNTRNDTLPPLCTTPSIQESNKPPAVQPSFGCQSLPPLGMSWLGLLALGYLGLCQRRRRIKQMNA